MTVRCIVSYVFITFRQPVVFVGYTSYILTMFGTFRFEESSKDLIRMRAVKVHITSPLCGNLVDGLPHACHNTETIAKLARMAPAKNDTTLEIQATIFRSEYVEVSNNYIKYKRDNVRSGSIWFHPTPKT